LKQKEECLNYIGERTRIDIENFEELKEYTKVDWVKLLGAVWIIDGEVKSDNIIEDMVNSQVFDVVGISVLDGTKVEFSCKVVPCYILISTNRCLNKKKKNNL
jgi:hypothetical protein